MYKDPEITITAALNLVEGNQSRLADLLGVNRSAITDWKRSGREHIPPLQAYRLQQMYPERFGDAA